MGKERVLLVDDEPNVLDGFRRSLRTQFKVSVATSGSEGIAVLERSAPFAVVVSDMRMPEMNGVEFLKRVKKVAPDTVRMMLTGNADQETAIQAVNHGHIFRFLTKPCSPQTLIIALTMGIRQHHLLIAEKELLEKTLKGSVELLTEVLSLSDPAVFVLASKVKGYLHAIQGAMSIHDLWALEVAALLSPIGFLTLPSELKTKVGDGDPLSPREESALRSVSAIGARLLAHVPRLDRIAAMVRHGVDQPIVDDDAATLAPDEMAGLRVLRLLFDLVRKEQTGVGVARALDMLKQQRRHDAALIEQVREALLQTRPEFFSGEYVVLDVTLKKVAIDDELSADVLSEDDRLLLAAGSRITAPFLERLFNYRKLVGVKEPLRVKRLVQKEPGKKAPETDRFLLLGH